MSQDQAVLLMSSYTADNIQEVNQRRVESSFEANKIDFISIDGALPENKDVRNILFGVSEQRGKVLLRPEELWNNSNNVVCCVLCVVCCVQASTLRCSSRVRMIATSLLDYLRLLKDFWRWVRVVLFYILENIMLISYILMCDFVW